jgi:hypothetical protein
MPEQRHATGDGKNSDLQLPPARSGRQLELLNRPRVATGQDVVHRPRELSVAHGRDCPHE